MRTIDYRLFKKLRNANIRLEVVGSGFVMKGTFGDVMKLIAIATRRGDLDGASFEMDSTK